MKALSSPAHAPAALPRVIRKRLSAFCTRRILLRAIVPHQGDLSGLDIDEVMRDPWFIPETTPAQDQLNAFLSKRNHFSLVIDEYGALQGLVTLEDILEEIVGDVSR